MLTGISILDGNSRNGPAVIPALFLCPLANAASWGIFTWEQNEILAMANTTWTKPGLWTELDALGEDMVKERLRMDFYGAPGMVGSKRALVEEWLLSKEVSRREALHARQAEAASQAVEAASRAAIAAERQAAVAERANTRATIALIIAAISAAAAIASIIISLQK